MSGIDRLKDAVEGIVRSLFPRADYMTLYACKVVSQGADGTVDVKPDHPGMPEHSGVPWRLPVGVAVKVSSGARVLLGFENGDPAKPYVTVGEVSSIDTLYVGTSSMSGADALQAIVRGTQFRTDQQTLHTQLQVVATAISAAAVQMTAAGPLVLLPPAGIAITAAAAQLTAAAAAMTAALTAYELSASTLHLQSKVKTP